MRADQEGGPRGYTTASLSILQNLHSYSTCSNAAFHSIQFISHQSCRSASLFLRFVSSLYHSISDQVRWRVNQTTRNVSQLRTHNEPTPSMKLTFAADNPLSTSADDDLRDHRNNKHKDRNDSYSKCRNEQSTTSLSA